MSKKVTSDLPEAIRKTFPVANKNQEILATEYVHVPSFLSEERRLTRRQIVRVLMHCGEIEFAFN